MIDRIYSVVVDGVPRLMLKLPTGAGKTRVALEAVYRLMRDKHVKVALWIADDKNLCQQAVDSALSTFQEPTNDIENLILVSFFDSNALIDLQMLHKTHAKPMLIVCTPHQLEDNLELIPSIDVFIMDEAHTSIERRFDLFEKLDARTLLGLSATPPTHWTETLTLSPINSFDATTTSTEEFLRIRGIISTINTVHRKVIEDIDYQVLDKLFKNNEDINFHHPFVTYSILANVRKDILSSSVSSVIVFVDRIEQASVLSSAFNALMPEHRSAHLDGDKMTTSQRQTILRRFKEGEIDVLFNVKLLREGFDAPNIDGVYLAQLNNPQPETTKYIQMVGRGLRGTASEGGTENCLVVELDFDYE
jgi:superfamily II DNA or RNA helicase